MKKVIMVDLEDTLSNTSQREHLVPPKSCHPSDWDNWNELLIDDPPTNIIPIIKELSKKYEIVISTAKPDKYRNIVEDWLEKYLGFIPSQVCMRRISDMKLTSPQLKITHLDFIRDCRWGDTSGLKFEIIGCIDDRQDVCDIYKSNEFLWWCYTKHLEYKPKWIKEILHNIKSEFKINTARDILKEASEIFKIKGKEYGNSYHEFGDLCFALFPKGIELKTVEDMNRWGVLELMLVKIQRYSNHFLTGGHKDSLDDLIVYTSMLQELDSLIKSNT